MSACNRGEGRLHDFAARLLGSLGRRVIVPWPVYVELHLVLRARGHAGAAVVFGKALLDGTHALGGPTDTEHERALEVLDRYAERGVDFVDATVMAMTEARNALVLTWDFRHFRASRPARRRHWPLLVQEHELPAP